MTKRRPPWRAIWTVRYVDGTIRITIEGLNAREQMRFLKRLLRQHYREAASRALTIHHLRSIVQ